MLTHVPLLMLGFQLSTRGEQTSCGFELEAAGASPASLLPPPRHGRVGWELALDKRMCRAKEAIVGAEYEFDAVRCQTKEIRKRPFEFGHLIDALLEMSCLMDVMALKCEISAPVDRPDIAVAWESPMPM